MTAAPAHAHTADAANLTIRRLALAMIITLAFVVIEALAGLYANSLALLTDAAHNLTDVITLGLSWYAVRLTIRPAHSGKTFGYHRAGILIALVNSTMLVLIALGVFYEAYQRLIAPPQVEACILVGVALVAFLVNTGTALLVKRGSEHDLNMRSAFVHLAGDAVATFGAILAGIGIALTGLQILDPLASILIGVLILWSAWGIVRESVNILLESTPRDIDMALVVSDLLHIDGVRGVHDLHVWSVTHDLRALSAHILTNDIPISTGAAIQRDINHLVSRKYGITHATLQLECAGCEPDLLYCDLTENNHTHAAVRDEG